MLKNDQRDHSMTDPLREINNESSIYSSGDEHLDDLSIPANKQKRPRPIKARARTFLDKYAEGIIVGMVVTVIAGMIGLSMEKIYDLNRDVGEIEIRIVGIESDLDEFREDSKKYVEAIDELEDIKKDYISGKDIDEINERLIRLETLVSK
jgi:hypothetical protein